MLPEGSESWGARTGAGGWRQQRERKTRDKEQGWIFKMERERGCRRERTETRIVEKIRRRREQHGRGTASGSFGLKWED